jgi:hypothetical protein
MQMAPLVITLTTEIMTIVRVVLEMEMLLWNSKMENN